MNETDKQDILATIRDVAGRVSGVERRLARIEGVAVALAEHLLVRMNAAGSA
jgi:hypothetical protein